MKPFNTESPEKKEKRPIATEPQPDEVEDYFDPATGTVVSAGPSHPDHVVKRPVEEDLPETT